MADNSGVSFFALYVVVAYILVMCANIYGLFQTNKKDDDSKLDFDNNCHIRSDSHSWPTFCWMIPSSILGLKILCFNRK